MMSFSCHDVTNKSKFRYHGREPDEAKVEKHIQTCKLKLEGYERILAKQKYLCGNVRYSACIQLAELNFTQGNYYG